MASGRRPHPTAARLSYTTSVKSPGKYRSQLIDHPYCIVMPPATKPLATQTVPDGMLMLKRQKHKSGLRLVVYLTSKTHTFSPCWLFSKEPRERLAEVLQSFPQIDEGDIEDVFKTALLKSPCMRPHESKSQDGSWCTLLLMSV